jgi:hypothetical protein
MSTPILHGVSALGDRPFLFGTDLKSYSYSSHSIIIRLRPDAGITLPYFSRLVYDVCCTSPYRCSSNQTIKLVQRISHTFVSHACDDIAQSVRIHESFLEDRLFELLIISSVCIPESFKRN